MENKKYVHYRPEDKVYQIWDEHSKNVSTLASRYCPIPELKNAAWILGTRHDDGKVTAAWQKYFEASICDRNTGLRKKEDHSTMGGLILERLIPRGLLLEMLQTVVYSHHGIQDCVSASDSVPLIERRKSKFDDKEVEEVQNLVFAEEEKAFFKDRRNTAQKDLNLLVRRIVQLSDSGDRAGKYGNRDFYLGMCERILFSSLIDADWRDTADFMDNRVTASGMKEEEIQQFWETGIRNLETYLGSFGGSSPLDPFREKISESCRAAAYQSYNLYRLSVPTGAGKTLSSLRFALYCAREQHKKHIFYIAPFCSILEQNADEIRKALGVPDMVLEHHSDVVHDKGSEPDCYERLIENWDEVPVTVTTAVQFFNTLFKEKRSNIRRLHSLCDSVIILDEVQAFPVRLTQLFNLAVNFLTQIGNTTVVLCTATQPLFDKVSENRMLTPKDMVMGISVNEEAFRRVEYHDCTEECAGGFRIPDAADFVMDKAEDYDQILMIVNTKACAGELYRQLKQKTDRKVYHLSTGMCAQHRKDMLKEIRDALENNEKIICVSTQLVEAGVNFSFQCVIRSLAGLDNLIQAAGRCNRNGLLAMGQVYLIRMSEEAERVASLTDIKKAQNAMLALLLIYRKNPDAFEGRLDSEKAIDTYYRYYFNERKQEMNYPVKVEGVSTNIVDLLSANAVFAGKAKNVRLKQAFMSAGEAFEVIEDKAEKAVVVPYGEAAALLRKLDESREPEERRKLMRELQRFCVNISAGMLQRLGNAVYGMDDNRLPVLANGYYSLDTGVQEEPADMQLLNY